MYHERSTIALDNGCCSSVHSGTQGQVLHVQSVDWTSDLRCLGVAVCVFRCVGVSESGLCLCLCL